MLLLMMLLLAAMAQQQQPQDNPPRPNILLITADDMNWDSVGVYGCPVANITPHIDALAAQGMQFDYAYVNIAICTPSRQVMLTGSHSHQTMTRGFTNVERIGPTLPDVLTQHGYFTAQVNKQQSVYDWNVSINEADTDFGRNVGRQGALARQIIENAATKPWFLVYNLNDPHRPFHGSDAERNRFDAVQRAQFSPPSRLYGTDEIVVPGFLPDLPDVRLEMAQYYSSVRRADDGVGALLQVLDETGQANRTVVVFLSDNGISNPFAKVNCYQASLRVPFIVRYPGLVTPGARDRVNMVSAIDLAPTLLELAGLPVPPHMAGRSFVPLLQQQDQEKRNHVIGYYYRNLRQTQMYPEFAVHMRDWVYIYNPWVDGKTQVHNSDYTNSPTLLAMWKAAEAVPSIQQRSEFHKYRIREELYNVRQDPHSYRNLVAEDENNERVIAMRGLLVEWMEETHHPALELMRDPHNEQLIEEYMAIETCNAAKQIQEADSQTTLNDFTCPSSSSNTKYIWIVASLACVLVIAIIARILYFRKRSS